MKSLGQLPLAQVEAKIQSRIAKFLAMKEVIVKLQKHPSPSISSKAKGLYSAQYSLENELKNALAKVEMIKSGAYTYSDVISVSSFAYDMDNHIKAVQALEQETGVSPIITTQAPSFSIWLVLGGLAIGALYLAYKR